MPVGADGTFTLNSVIGPPIVQLSRLPEGPERTRTLWLILAINLIGTGAHLHGALHNHGVLEHRTHVPAAPPAP